MKYNSSYKNYYITYIVTTFLMVRCLDKVSVSVLPYFNGVASKLIKERGAVEVLSAALAYISGVTSEMKSRSLLSSQPVCYSSVIDIIIYASLYSCYIRTTYSVKYLMGKYFQK